MNKKDLMVSDCIIESFINLLKKQNFNDVSITEICSNAKVSRNSFYRNFNSKEDILKKYIDNITDKFVSSQTFKYSNERFNDYIVMLFEHLTKQKNFALLLYKNQLLYLVKDEFDKYFIKDSKSKSEKYNRMYIAGGMFNIFEFWLTSGAKETPSELSNMFFNFYNAN